MCYVNPALLEFSTKKVGNGWCQTQVSEWVQLYRDCMRLATHLGARVSQLGGVGGGMLCRMGI